MTSKSVVLAALTCALWLPTAEASPQGKKFGLGLGLGSPTSLTGKFFLDRHLALDFALDFARFHGGFGLHGDILWHTDSLVSNDSLQLPLYLGAGLQFGFWDSGIRYDWRFGYYGSTSTNWGLRVPFGIALWLARVPLEFYAELGPEIWFGYYPFVNVFGTIGGRFYF
jgi:hypothetical protein